jgi:hypothetical protein
MYCDPSNGGRKAAAPPKAAEQAENRVFGAAILEQKVEKLFAPGNILFRCQRADKRKPF